MVNWRTFSARSTIYIGIYTTLVFEFDGLRTEDKMKNKNREWERKKNILKKFNSPLGQSKSAKTLGYFWVLWIKLIKRFWHSWHPFSNRFLHPNYFSTLLFYFFIFFYLTLSTFSSGFIHRFLVNKDQDQIILFFFLCLLTPDVRADKSKKKSIISIENVCDSKSA